MPWTAQIGGLRKVDCLPQWVDIIQSIKSPNRTKDRERKNSPLFLSCLPAELGHWSPSALGLGVLPLALLILTQTGIISSALLDFWLAFGRIPALAFIKNRLYVVRILHLKLNFNRHKDPDRVFLALSQVTTPLPLQGFPSQCAELALKLEGSAENN